MRDSRRPRTARPVPVRPGGVRQAQAAAPVSLARALSKLGVCSRSVAAQLIAAGRVQVDGRIVRAPARRVRLGAARLRVNGLEIGACERVYVLLNKPRGLVTSAADEQGRDTVYSCFAGSTLPWITPVGRLDRASEGLLLFSNDTRWAARLLDPAARVPRTYHVRIDRTPEPALLAAIGAGIVTASGERLAVRQVRCLRQGSRNAWLEIGLEEGRNRHIRRLLTTLDLEVLRLVRVAFGPLALGTLAKGSFRSLTAAEVAALASAAGGSQSS
ncbi:MAG: rRNA pseudouridine synthase [Gammaproteobacteria bacterium]|nr:rRNA pseudouridine synthase [Gammaproteobacteria bacterium]